MRLFSFIATALFFQLIVTGCKKPTSQPLPVVDLSTVKITAFQFSETANTSINITHPFISNGAEVQQGRIDIVIPFGTTGLQLTPLVSNFEKQGFTISPQLGVKTDYLNKEVVYTISSATECRYNCSACFAQQQLHW
ncbi:MAG: hypothetical protein GXC73_06720 [Chitinophagaceae bacterium]|nr:hypothetical protein [Chitinophagaceae bacterium]